MPSPGLRCLTVAIGLAAAGCTSSAESDISSPSGGTESPAAVATDEVFQRSTDGTVTTVRSSEPSTPTGAQPSTESSLTETTTTGSTTTSTTMTSTTTTTTTTTTTLPAGTPAVALDLTAETVLLGTSVEGRPITAERFGTPGGRRVLIIGVIHGNEDAGVAIVDELRSRAASDEGVDGIELWLVPSMNPDGEAAQDRHNANEVDLNRNFPFRWGTIGEPGDGQYAGPGPASEPETQAMVAFIAELAPDLALWYHQDANLMIPASGRDGEVRARYAELTGLPLASCCDGGIYTGIAATWARNEAVAPDGLAFIVELPGGDLTTEQVDQHASAVLTVTAEFIAN